MCVNTAEFTGERVVSTFTGTGANYMNAGCTTTLRVGSSATSASQVNMCVHAHSLLTCSLHPTSVWNMLVLLPTRARTTFDNIAHPRELAQAALLRATLRGGGRLKAGSRRARKHTTSLSVSFLDGFLG